MVAVLELIVCAVMILAYRTEVRWLEGRPADELGAARSAPLVLAGLFLGVKLFAGVHAVLWSVGAVAYPVRVRSGRR